MKPMLAHKWAQHGHKLSFPLFVQPKLNGVRMLFHDNQCQSRDEHWWHDSMLAEIRQELSKLSSNFILDGELYVHGWSLQEINGAASVNRIGPNAKTASVEYHVFDCVLKNDPLCRFSARWQEMSDELSSHILHKVKIVATIEAQDSYDAESQYSVFKRQRYEGMMYRDPQSSYGLASMCGNKENRWACLLKRKDFMDDTLRVVGYNEGEGKYSGMVGSLVLEVRPGLTVDCGSGISDLLRSEFMANPPIGKACRIHFEMHSDNGTPLKPIFEAILD